MRKGDIFKKKIKVFMFPGKNEHNIGKVPQLELGTVQIILFLQPLDYDRRYVWRSFGDSSMFRIAVRAKIAIKIVIFYAIIFERHNFPYTKVRVKFYNHLLSLRTPFRYALPMRKFNFLPLVCM